VTTALGTKRNIGEIAFSVGSLRAWNLLPTDSSEIFKFDRFFKNT